MNLYDIVLRAVCEDLLEGPRCEVLTYMVGAPDKETAISHVKDVYQACGWTNIQIISCESRPYININLDTKRILLSSPEFLCLYDFAPDSTEFTFMREKESSSIYVTGSEESFREIISRLESLASPNLSQTMLLNLLKSYLT